MGTVYCNTGICKDPRNEPHALFMALPRTGGYVWRNESACCLLALPDNCNGFHQDAGHVMGDTVVINDMSKFSRYADGKGLVQKITCGKCNEELGCKILQSSFVNEMGLMCLGDEKIKPEYAYILKGVEKKAEEERATLIREQGGVQNFAPSAPYSQQ